ncbi:cation-translocating P-type ATPase [Acetonema longum]|uniref:P-type Ca(2+) transporter n=1 Tax=Acetonema longum DSM 6540 TaxID=1009370 RepID=F7NMP0_9FIRM|nr:cation-translocating P-type ATPase [Acetonema longum]EGO62704.1 ATPase, P-type (transporting), HAD superfamily, subfamily IC [Acetonema longum DSM 6540]
MSNRVWYQQDSKEVVAALDSDVSTGLSSAEAEARLKQFGPNELIHKEGRTTFQMLLEQLKDFLVLILIGASIVSAFVGEVVDSLVIMAIVVLNAGLGVMQESRAEKALEALKKLAAPTSKVIRDGKQEVITSDELVPGDVIILETGDYVPADVRLLEAVNLKIEEASLTGESVPVEKEPRAIDHEAPLGDRKNMGFMSTVITYGRGKAVVTDTGMKTELGKIATMIQHFEDEQTPLQRRLEEFGKILGYSCLGICVIVFLLGLWRGEPLLSMFMIAVSLAVAAIPEGLPAVVTIVLALGMQRMVKRNAIVKKLHAVETLGSTTVICSDKTGTLTQNQMTVVRVFAGNSIYELTGEGYNPQGSFSRNGQLLEAKNTSDLDLLLKGGSLCNDASLRQEESSKTWRIAGDPTEGALIVAAAKAGYSRQTLNDAHPRIQEIPFDSARKMMTTFHQDESQKIIAFVKGAPDILLGRCTHIQINGEVHELTQEIRQTVLEANQDMAKQALRVLAVAYRRYAALPDDITAAAVEQSLIFTGLLGMIDPARPEVKDAVKVCRTAGIRPVMITGDYRDTAFAIAQELGIADDESTVMTGPELDKLSPDELRQVVRRSSVFARVSPENKVAIVDALQQNQEIAAMTGDGVNDAPALKKARIGVAMGITGTDVTKETADIVLTDDNFASIVSAVEEGRVIYSNIRKFVFFLLSCNFAEILLIFLTMLLGWPIPLLPIHLLLLNLVTDAFPALALGMEQREPGVMDQPPRDPNESLIDVRMRWMIGIQSTVLALAVIGSFKYALNTFGGDLEIARTYSLATLISGELLRAYSTRSEFHSIFKIGVFSNKYMNLGVLASFAILMLAMYSPFSDIFRTVHLSFWDWDVILAFAALPLISAELGKVVLNRMHGHGATVKNN